MVNLERGGRGWGGVLRGEGTQAPAPKGNRLKFPKEGENEGDQKRKIHTLAARRRVGKREREVFPEGGEGKQVGEEGGKKEDAWLPPRKVNTLKKEPTGERKKRLPLGRVSLSRTEGGGKKKK